MAFLDIVYNQTPAHRTEDHQYVYPCLIDLFENFKMCSFQDTKVVIMGSEPAGGRHDTGIPLGNLYRNHGASTGQTIRIERAINKLYKAEYAKLTGKKDEYNFDSTLYSWLAQGVLTLYASNTKVDGVKMGHKYVWRDFNRNLIERISEAKEKKVVFCFWGEEAQYFAKYVDISKHTVLQYTGLDESLANGTDWNCTHFKTIDAIIEKEYGKDAKIYW